MTVWRRNLRILSNQSRRREGPSPQDDNDDGEMTISKNKEPSDEENSGKRLIAQPMLVRKKKSETDESDAIRKACY